MLLVYVDTGGMLKEVAALEIAGFLKPNISPSSNEIAGSRPSCLARALLGSKQSELERGSGNLERLQSIRSL